jgi:ABC-type branched-subunit amino acid transport system permease subunit
VRWAVMSLGHIEPTFSFWTTSGEFVFVAILAGWQSVAAVFVASTVLEVVRSFSSSLLSQHLAIGPGPVPAGRSSAFCPTASARCGCHKGHS